MLSVFLELGVGQEYAINVHYSTFTNVFIRSSRLKFVERFYRFCRGPA